MKTFYQLDVFTDKAFAGNPLAVFPDGEDLSGEQMQMIAREMNLSETVFVLPPKDSQALRRLRIFTPTKELPMAGHPVVGTWNLLARLGYIEYAPVNGLIEIKQELGIGVLPVEIEFADAQPQKVTMTQGAFSPGEIVADQNVLEKIAAAFELSTADFLPSAPIQVAGCGVNFTIVPLRSLAALKKCRADSGKLEFLPKSLPGEFSLFAFETIEQTSLIHTRMFAPEFGIVEDPATGSAAGALGGYLVHHNLLRNKLKPDAADVFQFTIEQGDFINRPSRIAAEITGTPHNVQKVRIGGASVIIAQGELFI